MGSIFFGATSLNCNLAAWNVLRVTNATGSFDSTSAMVDCYKRSVYGAWGPTLQAAYPTWSSFPATCVYPEEMDDHTPSLQGRPNFVNTNAKTDKDCDMFVAFEPLALLQERDLT